MASLNKVILMGNLVADPELKTTQSGISVTSFTVAVGRRYAKETDEIKADFINVVCWRSNAEFVSKYFTKGKPIIIVGELQTRNYLAQDGTKRYVTEVVANEVTFAGNASSNSNQSFGGAGGRTEGTYYGGGAEMPAGQPRVSDANFEEIAAEDDLPF